MYEHRAREHELLDLEVEVAQPAQHPARAAHGDLLVLRARLAQEVVVRGEMDERRDAAPVVLTDRFEPLPDAVVRGDVDRDIHAARRRRVVGLAIEADDVTGAAGESPHHRIPDPTVRTRDDDDAVVCRHRDPRSSRPRYRTQPINSGSTITSWGDRTATSPSSWPSCASACPAGVRPSAAGG